MSVVSPEYGVILQTGVDIILIPLQNQCRSFQRDAPQCSTTSIVDIGVVGSGKAIDDTQEPHVTECAYDIRRWI